MAANTLTPHFCWICNKAVSLNVAKTDENGHIVHEDCYALRMQLEGAFSDVGVCAIKPSQIRWTWRRGRNRGAARPVPP